MSALAKQVTLAIAAIIVAIAMILSIVSVSTDLWITASANGITLQQGLWRQCVEHLDQGKECTKFDKDAVAGTMTKYWL